MATAYLGLGSNLGDRRANLRRALELLEPQAKVDAVSALYESAPQPPAPPPDYLNAACRVTTDLSPQELLAHVKAIESQTGRVQGPRWAPRPIDIDIELYDGLVIETPDLTIPHPRLRERNFVLQPLLDIAPDVTHPATGERFDNLLQQVGNAGLRRLSGPGWHLVRERET
jgi:2-amino-4-hydroxy-6-hydroxymethyldihydropteridine diphosphokinase